MSNRNPDSRYANLPQILDFHFKQSIKELLHTCLPGIVESYEPNTKRVRVAPAPNLVMTDRALPTLRRSPIVNVPVLWPSSGGLSLRFPIAAGDAVLLLFSERGLEGFKQEWGKHYDPPPDVTFDQGDAIAIPGFGPESIVPASDDGATLQTDDGGAFIEVAAARVRIRHGSQDVTLSETGIDADVDGDAVVSATGNVFFRAARVVIDGQLVVTGKATLGGGADVSGGALTHESVNVGADHTHPGVQKGGAMTGGPLPL